MLGKPKAVLRHADRSASYALLQFFCQHEPWRWLSRAALLNLPRPSLPAASPLPSSGSKPYMSVPRYAMLDIASCVTYQPLSKDVFTEAGLSCMCRPWAAIQDIFVARRVRWSNHSGTNASVWYKCDTDQSSFTILLKFTRHQGGGAGKLPLGVSSVLCFPVNYNLGVVLAGCHR